MLVVFVWEQVKREKLLINLTWLPHLQGRDQNKHKLQLLVLSPL